MNRLEIANNISTNIERERTKLGMSQAQFAKALDMSLSTYKRIANGESSRIDVYTAYLIYKLTGRFSCELTGFNDDVINLVKRIKKLSKSQRILIDSIIDTELALSAYKDESSHTEDLISVLIPTGNMTDGMILDSYNVEKLDVSNYRKAFGDALHIGIRITSNHLHPVYNKGDILLISRNPIRDGDTGIFITPGFDFKLVDLLVTNFHLPKSSLMMLVSAFAGYGHIMALYREAIARQYRFFSYGDAMLLARSE